jgi:uncharacterized glyoxalase superfamily protein PhnB
MPGYTVIPSIRVRDVARSLDFYTTTLGFEITRGGPDEDNNSLKRGDASVMIEAATDFYSPAYNAAIRDRLGSPSPNALYIEAEDLGSLYAGLQAKGIEIIDPLAERPWGQSEFTVEDPDGNWLTFWKASNPQ